MSEVEMSDVDPKEDSLENPAEPGTEEENVAGSEQAESVEGSAEPGESESVEPSLEPSAEGEKDPANIDDLNAYDPLLDSEALQPLLKRRDHSIKELLDAMDEYAPIIPDAVTDYYLTKAGFKTNDHRVKRLLALATQKFLSDIATDAYQFARIRSQSSSTSMANSAKARNAPTGKVVLTMEDLSNVLTEFGINARRPEFYR